MTTIKWAAVSGKPFLGTGIAPSVEVKRPELAELIDPEDLTGNDDDAVAQPARPEDNRAGAAAADGASPKQPADDIQLKKALELLREKSTNALEGKAA
ncbi:MAG: hypothetical protein WKF30_11700 [Pyrinomonadaceae bacterium]